MITFERANSAIKAEQLLRQAGVNSSVMPVVPQIAAGCGIALRIKPFDLEKCRETLTEAGVVILSVYERKADERGYDYVKI